MPYNASSVSFFRGKKVRNIPEIWCPAQPRFWCRHSEMDRFVLGDPSQKTQKRFGIICGHVTWSCNMCITEEVFKLYIDV